MIKGYIAHSQGDLQRSIQIPVHLQSTAQTKKYEQQILRLLRKKAKHFFQNGVNAATEFLQRWDFHEWKQKYRLSEKIKPTDKLCRFYFLMMVMMSVFAYFKAVCNCEVSAFVNAVLFIVCHVTYY